MDPFETVTLATERPEPLTWQYDGLCRMRRDGREWDRRVVAEWTDRGHGECEDPDRSVWFVPDGRLGQRSLGMSVEAVDGSWHAEHAYTLTTRDTTTELEWSSMWHRSSFREGTATVLLFEKPCAMIFPHALPVVPGVAGRHFREHGLRTRLFGREALLRFVNVGSEELLALGYQGAPIDEAGSLSIITVLSLAFGRDLEPLSETTVDAEGKMVARTLWRRIEPSRHDARPALNCVEEASTAALGAQLDFMARNACLLRYYEDSAIDVAVRQLLSSNGGRLDFEIRDIALALDVIIEAPTFSPKNGRIVDKKIFAPLRNRLLQHLEEMRDVPGDLRTRFEEGIKQSNGRSTRQKRAAFWQSLGRDAPPADAEMLASRRNTMSHKGFIDVDDPLEELQMLSDISRGRTLVNEVLLAILGYEGPIADYEEGRSRVSALRWKR